MELHIKVCLSLCPLTSIASFWIGLSLWWLLSIQSRKRGIIQLLLGGYFMVLGPNEWFPFTKSPQKLERFDTKRARFHQESSRDLFFFQDCPIYKKAWQKCIGYFFRLRNGHKAEVNNLTEQLSWWKLLPKFFKYSFRWRCWST